ncbi:MAG: hypothetical protein K6G03_02960, partial [Lachnospiraceae bacterium]|nr:hypothetical protein [Lachnospiraceae bacterium]
MRRRRITKAGRLSALFMAFLIAFSGTSTYTVQTVEAAVETSANTVIEEELDGLLSVGTVVREDWQYDDELKALLAQRDLEAAEYARENNINGTNTTSGSLGSLDPSSGISADWLSNVLYKGDILRSDTFDGFVAVYGDGADAAVIDGGVNEIDVTLIPISDKSISENGIETDISSWDTIPGFASRIMLPHWNGLNELLLKSNRAYRTKLFVVGINGGALSKGSIYSKDNMLDYPEYLSYIGAKPSTANLSSYMQYVSTFRDIEKEADSYQNDQAEWDEWVEWYETTQKNERRRSGSGSSGGKKKEDEDTPAASDGIVKSNSRTIMIYMDGADLGDHAISNLNFMLRGRKDSNPGDDSHIIILTGGSNNSWKDNKIDESEIDISKALYDKDLKQNTDLYKTLGTKTQLWELKTVNGKPGLVLLDNGNISDSAYMTDKGTLQEFIKRTKALYGDSDCYDLIMWDHGGGPEGGFGSDQRKKNDMSMPLVDITSAIKDCGVNFDFIAFDACLMSNAEIAIALSPYTKYLILSEQEFPGTGFYSGYESLISLLGDNPNMSTDTYAKSLIDDIIAYYNKTDNKNDATLALIESAKVSDGLSTALANFAKELNTVLTSNNQSVLDEIIRIRKSYSYNECKSSFNVSNDLIDLTVFCRALKTDKVKNNSLAFYNACESLADAADKCMIDFKKSVRHDASRTLAEGAEPEGMSIYFPSFSMSVAPLGKNDGTTDQILNLVSAYKSSDKLESYGKALAAYGLWVKVGVMLGREAYW